jgi:hypothetical protein
MTQPLNTQPQAQALTPQARFMVDLCGLISTVHEVGEAPAGHLYGPFMDKGVHYFRALLRTGATLGVLVCKGQMVNAYVPAPGSVGAALLASIRQLEAHAVANGVAAAPAPAANPT